MDIIQALQAERGSASIKSLFNIPPSFQSKLFSLSYNHPIMIFAPKGPFSMKNGRCKTFSDIVANKKPFKYNEKEFSHNDYQLLSQLFENKDFCICPSNIELLGEIAKYYDCKELKSLYELAKGSFDKIGEINQLIRIQNEVFNLNLKFFNEHKKLLGCFSYYIAVFLYQFGTSRPLQTIELAEFASKLCQIDKQLRQPGERTLKQSIGEYFFSRLRVNQKLRNYRFKRRYPFYLFRQFYEQNLFDVHDLLESIFQLNNPEGLFWFLDILPQYMEDMMFDLMKERDIRIYEHNAKVAADLKANNFEKFKYVVKNALSDGLLIRAIQTDDVETLIKQLTQFTVQENAFSTPIQLINGLLPPTELLSYAALHSSINCYKYLLALGYKPNKTTIRAALLGGNNEIIHLIWNTINHTDFFSTFLKDACRYHRNDVFEWIYGQIPPSDIQSNVGKLVESIMFRSLQEFNFEIFLEFLHQYNMMHTLTFISAEMGNPIIYEFMWNISNRTIPLNIYFLNEFTYDTICTYNPNYQPTFYNQFNNPTLFYRFFKDQLKNVKSFPQIQASLFLAIQNHQYFPLKILYDMCRNIIVNECNSSKVGFLRTRVAEYSNPAILYLFLQDPRIDVNKTPEGSNGTAFTLTIWKNLVAGSHILYNTGKVKINQTGNIGETPLTSCVSEEHQYAGLIDFLITLPEIDVNAKNHAGRTAIELATQRNYADAARILLKSKKIKISKDNINKLVYTALLNNDSELLAALFQSGKVNVSELALDTFYSRKKHKVLSPSMILTIYTMIDAKEMSNNHNLKKLICKMADLLQYTSFPGVGPAFKDLPVIHYALAEGRLDTLRYLLTFPEINPNYHYIRNKKDKKIPLVECLRRNLEPIYFAELINSPLINISAFEDEYKKTAIKQMIDNDSHLVEMFLYLAKKLDQDPKFDDAKLFEAIFNYEHLQAVTDNLGSYKYHDIPIISFIIWQLISRSNRCKIDLATLLPKKKLELLRARGFDINYRLPNGDTLLIAAARHPPPNRFDDFYDVLASVEYIKTDILDSTGKNAATIKSQRGNH